MTNTNSTSRLWVGQPFHFSFLSLLLVLVYFVWNYLGQPFPVAFWCAIAFPVLHQIFVWLTWRLELHCAAISKSIGFRGYILFFFLLFFGRFISLLALAWIDRGSLNLQIIPLTTFTTLLALPGLYAMYSVVKYFGMARAAGADHFDPKYRDIPLVKKGIFRFTSNGMFLYAFLLFWAIAVGFNSIAALLVAAFSHVYVWVHYYATEKPDMEFLYNSADKKIQ